MMFIILHEKKHDKATKRVKYCVRARRFLSGREQPTHILQIRNMRFAEIIAHFFVAIRCARVFLTLILRFLSFTLLLSCHRRKVSSGNSCSLGI